MAEGIKLKSPELIAKKFLERTRTAVPFYVAGIKTPKRSPTEAAIGAAEAWHAKVSAAETKDKWIARRSAAGDEKWLFGIESKGIERYPKGCEVGAVWMYDFMTKFLPHLAEGLAKVYEIQKVDLDAAIKRVETLIRHNAAFRYEPSKMGVEDAKKLLEKIRALRI